MQEPASTIKRITLIDDESSVLFALRLLLEALGYSVRAFPVAAEGIESARAGEIPDLFLCDLKIPRMSGLDVLREVKSFLPELPFILMSAHATAQDVQLAKSLGANGFLSKPFTPQQLNSLVSSIQDDVHRHRSVA